MHALKKEILFYSKKYGTKNISSVYIGGGTPLLVGYHILEIAETMRNSYNVTGDFGIEANPNDITQESISLLKEAGFNSLSIGVQSFDDKLLKSIGRKYTSYNAEKSIEMALLADFDSVNLDILFALPNEKEEQLENDLKKVISLKPSQITTYPLFTFPYSEISNFKKTRGIKSPSLMKRRRMYYKIYDSLENAAYKRCSVWSFKRDSSVKRYSSVTRENYIGF